MKSSLQRTDSFTQVHISLAPKDTHNGYVSRVLAERDREAKEKAAEKDAKAPVHVATTARGVSK